MTTQDGDLEFIESLIAQHDGARPERTHLQRRLLRGGLEAASIEHVTAHYMDGEGRDRTFSLVVKQLVGSAAREVDVYEQLVTRRAADLAPRLYGAVRAVPERVTLYLEALEPISSWPWRDRHAAQSVLQAAAALHARAADREVVAPLVAWDYEAELQASAAETLERLEQLRRLPGLWQFGGALRWTRRVVAALPALRQQLLAFQPFGSTVLHGDLHSGNVMLRARADRAEPVLLDWGRARIGSPLEDVSSWLHSLGAWEPEARRRHDTLFVGYLAARGMEPRLDASTRAAYWLAGASNALAGALGYYVSLLLDPALPSAGRVGAATLVRDWVRVLRRADAFWS